MTSLPFFIVTLTQPTWAAALACAESLPEDALPELRLDLFSDRDAAQMVRDLKGRCLVTCRRASEYGRWSESEDARLARLGEAAEALPLWVDLEWELEVPAWLQALRPGVKVLRSVHVQPGIFDLDERLNSLPDGDAFKWVGHAAQLSDNARMKTSLHRRNEKGVALSAFLMGPKGIASRCMQRAWGGTFTYAAPDDGMAAAPGQVRLSTLKEWGCELATAATKLCAVIGDPVLHSRSPAFHNRRFREAGKNFIYLPLESGDADEASRSLDALEIMGLSITAPLKESLPSKLELQGPLNTVWRRSLEDRWHGANTDAEALWIALEQLPPGPILLLGNGGVAESTRLLLEQEGRPFMQASRKKPADARTVSAFAPIGVIQATSLGMNAGDPAPFPDLLEAARPSLRWAVEWIYKEDTAFAKWARSAELALVEGSALFEAQAEGQNHRFIEGCG